MKKNLMFIAIATIGLASCKGGFKQADGGLLYDISNDKSGTTIKAGDFMSLNLVLKTEGDSVINSTYEMGHPIQTLMPKDQKKGDITTGFLLMSEGDSATFKMNLDTIFKKGGPPKPPGLKGKYLIYNVKIEKVIPRGSLSEVVFQGRISDYVKSQTEVLKKAELARIKKYAEDNKITATTTASGLSYQITQQGTGANIAVGDTAVVNYTGKLSNGKIFDSSIKEDAVKAATANKMPVDPRRQYEPMRVPVGLSKVIKGWDEGLQLLNKGSKATFLVPSFLGFGEQGAPPMIPAFATTIFTVEVVDIKHPNPNAPKIEAPQPPAVR